MRYVDLTGQQINMLTVLNRVASVASGRHAKWYCKCSCGKIVTKQSNHLKSKSAYSCGCVRRDHGPRKYMNGRPKEYYSWQAMKRRCTNKKHKSFKIYKNIKVHPSWETSFCTFLYDMGPKPTSAHSIDRYPDPTGDYVPWNCRWATAIEQNNNKTNNHIVTYQGVSMTTAQWARDKGIKYSTLKERLKNGWSVEKALTTQVK